MKVNLVCAKCGGRVRPKRKKLETVLGGAVALWLMGIMLATPVGWLSVISGVLAGSANARKIYDVKVKLAVASSQAGSWFDCRGCNRDVPLTEVFGG